MYAIRKGVPIPSKRTGTQQIGRRAKYPFRSMKPGDSFVVKTKGEATKRVALRVSVAAAYASRNTGFKFTTRTLGNSVAAWRVA